MRWFDCFSGPAPGPPRNLTVRRHSEGLMLSWLAPRNTTVGVTHYVIQYRIVTNIWLPLADRSGDMTKYVWKSMSNGAKYTFRVLSSHNGVLSPPSNSYIFVTGGKNITSQCTGYWDVKIISILGLYWGWVSSKHEQCLIWHCLCSLETHPR